MNGKTDGGTRRRHSWTYEWPGCRLPAGYADVAGGDRLAEAGTGFVLSVSVNMVSGGVVEGVVWFSRIIPSYTHDLASISFDCSHCGGSGKKVVDAVERGPRNANACYVISCAWRQRALNQLSTRTTTDDKLH